MLDNMTTSEIIKLVAPLILIQLVLIITCVKSLIKTEVNYLPKWVWLLIILFINLLGPVIYLLFGRKKV